MLIDALFKQGKSVKSYPFLLLWQKITPVSAYPAQVLISAPTKRFPKAHQRNRVKRLIREVYRLNKSSLYSYLSNNGIYIALAIIYTGKEMHSFEELDRKIKVLFQRFIEDMETNG